jgi:hypothetical protein
MRALTAREIIQVWEWGQDKHPLDRARGLLLLAQPELSAEQVTALSIGQRNARLLALRGLTLGPQLQGFARCPACAAALEFTVDDAELRQPEPAGLRHTCQVDGFDLAFRLPNSTDLAAIAGCDVVEAARALLIDRCLLWAVHDGQPVLPSNLPGGVVLALAEAVSDADPQADIHFSLTCADCGHTWSALFDVATFFWVELQSVARRLLQDTTLLARTYGWSEAEILGMSAPRRQFYLGLAG